MRRRQILGLNTMKKDKTRAKHIKDLAEDLSGSVYYDRFVKGSDISALYEKKFGKPPHHRMKRATILERLNDTGDSRALDS